MTETVDRRCEACKATITINRYNVADVVQFQKKYYHYDCFYDMATKKANSKRGKPEMWQDALDRIHDLQVDAKESSQYYFVKEDLNDWLIDKYGFSKVPTTFWHRVADLEQGSYGRRKCKPISMATLLETWKWGWKKLSEIHSYNQSKNKGPQDAENRLIYDFSIVIQKVPNYLAYKAKQEAEELERQKLLQNNIKINYELLGKQAHNRQEDRIDIASIIDDIF